MYFFFFLLAAVQAVPPIQMKSSDFHIIYAGNPVNFNHSVYIFSYEECRFTAGVLDGGILKSLQNANAPYGCYISSDATPPTIYWNPVETAQDCSSEFGCIVTEATSRDTFFYGELALKNVSDKRLTQTQFPKKLFDQTPTILTVNQESVRQDDCKINCDPNFNDDPYEQDNSCQTTWFFEPMQTTRGLTIPAYVTVQDNFWGSVCSDAATCEDTCLNDLSCMGYTQYDKRDDTLDWPSTSVVYEGAECNDETDCKQQCKENTACEGYTYYWWPVYGDNNQISSTQDIPAEECTTSLLNRIYPSDHQFADTATPGYSRLTNYRGSITSTNGISGCQIRDEKCNSHVVSGHDFAYRTAAGTCSGTCYTQRGRGYNVFNGGGDGSNVEVATGSFSVSIVHEYYDWNSVNYGQPWITAVCGFESKNTGIRKRDIWFYGEASTTTSPYFSTSKSKSANTVEYQYGLKLIQLSLEYSRKTSFRKVVGHQNEDYKNNVFSLTKSECISAATNTQNTQWRDYDLSTVRIATVTDIVAIDVQELNGVIDDVNTDKLPYGCIAAANGKFFWNSQNSEQTSVSNFQQCGVFQIESYTGYPAESTLDTTSNLNDFILDDDQHYSVTCLQHPLVDCTWKNNFGGKLFEKDLFNFPTTNEDIAYVQSDRRISLLHPIKSNTEDALRYCLDLCDRTDQCFYANIGDDNACEMYRKCESTTTSNKALYRKLPFFLNLSSTLSDHVTDYYYDIGVLDNACNTTEPRPECYLDYCNRHLDIKALLCDTTCDSEQELQDCKQHWETIGSLDASRNFDPETECTRSLVIAETSRDNNCPEFCVATAECNIAYKTDDACYALPQCIMTSGQAKGHVITQIIRNKNYHELFPYNAFWPCDAMVLENSNIDACIEEARREDRFVFSYNNDTGKCLIYEHYVENAYDELMDHGINASWCYSNDVLQTVITSLGTCSAAVQDEQNNILQLVDGAFKTLVDRGFVEVTQAECGSTALIDAIKLQVAEKFSGVHAYGSIASGTFNIPYMKSGCAYYTDPLHSEVPDYNRVLFNTDTNGVDAANIDSYAICKKNGEYIVLTDPTIKCKTQETQDTCINPFTTLTSTATIDLSSNLLTYLNVVDALTACFETPDCNYIVMYTAQQQIVLAKEVTVTVHEVSSGAPDMSITKEECQEYAESVNKNFALSGSIYAPAGCIVRYDYDGVQYNTNIGSKIYGATDFDICGYEWRCIQQTGTSVGTYAKVNKLCDLPPNACIDLETRAITTKTSGYADTSIVEIFDNYTRTSMDCQSAAEELGYDYKGKYRTVTSGAPDLSVSEEECSSMTKYTWGGLVSISGEIKGCYLVTDTEKVYYNTNADSVAECSLSARLCIQKLPLDVANGCVLYENNVYWNRGPFSDIVVANSFNECLDLDHCFVGKPELASDFTPMLEEVSSGAPDLSVAEEECKIFANSIGLTFTAHDDAAITGIDWYDNGGCYCTSHYGKVDPGAGAARYTREWSTANGVASTEACRDLCYNLQEAKAVQGCSRLPVSTVRSDTSMNDVIVYIRNSYYDPPIQCNANNFAGTCIQKKQLSLEDCMVAVHKLGKEAGHHALGASIDGSGVYTGGTCWSKNTGVLNTSIAAPNVEHKTSGFPTNSFTAATCGSAEIKLGLSQDGAIPTITDFFKAQGCVEVDGELVFNDRSTATNTIASEFISVKPVQLLDTCQAACQTDDDCIGQLICSSDTTGCTVTYRVVNSGEADSSVSKEECRQYAKDIGRPFILVDSTASWASYIAEGCTGHDTSQKDIDDNIIYDIYWNEDDNTANCNEVDPCIQKYKHCVYDGHCSEQYPCIEEREQCATRRRRLLIYHGGGDDNAVVNPNFADAAYNEDISCTRVEYWSDREVSSFNVKTKENNIGGYLIPGRFYESTSGSPDASMTDDDCKLYADEILAGYDQNVNNPGPGCVVTADKQEVLYNPGSCQHSDQNYCFCSNSNICIQKHDADDFVPITDVDYCRQLDNFEAVINDPRKPYGCFQESSIVERVRGFPDNSVSEEECRRYAGNTWGAYQDPPNAQYNSDLHQSGCIRLSGGIYYNHNMESTLDCTRDEKPCIVSVVQTYFNTYDGDYDLSLSLFQAPCTAATPCLRHREKPFNATYVLDPVTGISTCYEGSGGLGMIVDPRDHFDFGRGYNSGTATDNGDGTRTMTRGGGDSVYDITNALPLAGWVDGVIYKITIEAKISSGTGTLAWRSGWTTYWTGALRDEFQTWIFYRVGNWGPNAFKSYISDVTFKQFKIETNNIAISSINASIYAKSRLLERNIQEELPAISGLVRSDDCLAPYQWSEIIEVSSKAPDLSVNADECRAYADATAGKQWISQSGWSDRPSGCHIYSQNGNIYFNTFNFGVNCYLEFSCIQKYNQDNYKTYFLGSVEYDVGADSCDTCFPGHYTSEDGVCLPCQAGRYTSKQRIEDQGYMSSCTICEVGRFQNEEGQASCKACRRGNYQNERGQLNCKTVDSGKFGVGTGAWTGTSGPDQSNFISDTATFLEGATDQLSECDPDKGYFYNCINSDGSKFRPLLGVGDTIQSVCPGGNFECAQCGFGTKIENNGCVACPQGQYQNADFAIGDSCKLCIAGQYQDQTGSRNCKPTQKGYYQNQEGQSFEIKCDTGRFADTKQSIICKLCLVGRSASEGQTLLQSGTSRDTLEECFQCSEGLYQDEEGMVTCKNCEAGQFTTLAQFGSGFNQHQFDRCLDCSSGFYRPTSISPNCQAANPGYFVEATGATSQQACPIGSKSASAETNPNCQRCEAGKFQDEEGKAVCKNCLQGFFTTSLGYHTVCTACEPGETTSGTGQTSCIDCLAGTYSSSLTAFICTDCSAGFYSAGAASECTACPKGFNGFTGTRTRVSIETACEACGVGTYQDEEGQSDACKICGAGRYSDTTTLTDADDCKLCPAGTFLTPGTAASSHDSIEDCIDCQINQPGTFSTAGSAACAACPAGNQATKSGGSDFVDLCLPCSAGRYNNDENSNCKLCSSLQYQNEEGKISCKPCGVGKVASSNRLKCDVCSNGQYRSATMTACANCPVGRYNDGDYYRGCAAVASNQCANSGATSPTNTYSNDCGTVSGSAICRCKPTGACVRCLDYSNREMKEIASATYQTVTTTLSCFESYSGNYVQLGLCTAGSIGGLVRSSSVLLTNPVCEHYVTSGC